MIALLALAAALVAASSASEQAATSPLLLWSNQRVVGSGSGAQVMYQVLSDAPKASADAVLALLGRGEAYAGLVNLQNAATMKETQVVVFVGSQVSGGAVQAKDRSLDSLSLASQLGSADLRQGKAAKLNAILDSAASSLVLPYTSGQVCMQSSRTSSMQQ